MTFLDAYKRLDNLCKDMYSGSRGVSAYIDDLERFSYAAYQIRDWDSVYQKLKHYRYIRNQIVHENYATEDNMCNESDARWIEDFYQQILETSDPLAQYRMAQRQMAQLRMSQYQKTSRPVQPQRSESHAPSEPPKIPRTGTSLYSWSAVFFCIVVLIIMIILICSSLPAQ